jgi:hypothetical protein
MTYEQAQGNIISQFSCPSTGALDTNSCADQAFVELALFKLWACPGNRGRRLRNVPLVLVR